MKLNKSVIIGMGALAIAGAGAYKFAHLPQTNPPVSEQFPSNTHQREFAPIQNSDAFDFYVLSLSWSPTYCLLNQDDKSAQCKQEHNFIVHGLWPQFEHGYPRECQSNVKHIDYKLVQSMLDIMPSERLVNIEWDRHGTCSSLSPDNYFKTVRAAYEKVHIPKLADGTRQKASDVETAFMNINKGLTNDMIAITTKEGKLNEVRVCLTQNLEFRTCPEVDKNAARENYRFLVPSP